MSDNIPLVKFGKYKEKPVTELLNDKNYVDWLKQQSWFSNYKIIYNIVVNQQVINNNSSKTPQHNKLQNMFLKNEFKNKFIEKIYNCDIHNDNLKKLTSTENFDKYFHKLNDKFHSTLKNIKIIFEDKFNWDFIIYDDDNHIFNIIELNVNPNNEILNKNKIKIDFDKVDMDNHKKNINIFDDKIEFRKNYDYNKLKKYEDELKKYEDELKNNGFSPEIIKKYEKDIINKYNKDLDENFYDELKYLGFGFSRTLSGSDKENIKDGIKKTQENMKNSQIEYSVICSAKKYLNLMNVKNIEDITSDNFEYIINCAEKEYGNKFDITYFINPYTFVKMKLPEQPKCSWNIDESYKFFRFNNDEKINEYKNKYKEDDTLYSANELENKKNEYIKKYNDEYENRFYEYYKKESKIFYKKIVGNYFSDVILENGIISKICLEIKEDRHLPNICCEIKPILSDDYPNVLRKMKNQIQLLESSEINDKFIYVLFIDEFKSDVTSVDELRMIFNQSNIKIIFLNEIN